MSKLKTLSSIIAGLFGRSEKAISEKLSTEEHAEFSADVNELNEKLEAQVIENERITGELATAAARITELEGSETAAQAQVNALTASLETVTADRDKYKAHYDEAAEKGDKNADQDHNSRGKSGKASYNENAINAWHKANK